MPAEPATFDIELHREPNAWPIVLPQMNWLVANEQGGRGLTPDLALRWEVAEGGRRYTFHLASGLSWHDGTPFTPRDVAFSLLRIRDNVTAPYRLALASIQQVEVGKETVVVTLRAPDPAFLPSLGAIGNVVLPNGYAAERLEALDATGTGPFKLTQRLPGAKFVLAANPTYFKRAADPALPYLDGVEVTVAPDATVGYALMRLGRVDMAPPLPASAWGASQSEVRERAADFTVAWFPSVLYDVLLPNKDPWRDRSLRQALRGAFDRQALNEAAATGYGDLWAYLMPGDGQHRWALPPSLLQDSPGYGAPPIIPIEFRARLQAAAGPREWTARAPAEAEAASAALAVQLRNLFGDGATLTMGSPADHLGALVGQRFDLALEAVSTPIDDPGTAWARRFKTLAPENYGRWSDSQIDRLLDRIAVEMDPAARMALAQEVQRTLFELSWVIGLGTDAYVQMRTKAVTGVLTPLHLEDGPFYRLERVRLSGG